MGRKENDIDNLDLNLETDFNLDLDLDENKDLVFPEGNEYFKNEDSRKYRLNTKSVLFGVAPTNEAPLILKCSLWKRIFNFFQS